MMPSKNEAAGVGLEAAREDLVLLWPGEESMKVIGAGEYVPAGDAPRDEAIVAVVASE